MSKKCGFFRRLFGMCKVKRPPRRMSGIDRKDVASKANEIAEDSRKHGRAYPARLSVNSSLRSLEEWLQWNDPNGSHLRELAEEEGEEPYDLESAWDAVEQMVRDY